MGRHSDCRAKGSCALPELREADWGGSKLHGKSGSGRAGVKRLERARQGCKERSRIRPFMEKATTIGQAGRYSAGI